MPRPVRIAGQTPEEWTASTREQFEAVAPGASGAKPLHLPSVIAHHPTYLAPYLEWAKAIALRGVLEPRVNALLALRTAWHCRSEFEWGVHANSALTRGLVTADELRALAARGVPDSSSWAPGDMLVVRAADELCVDHTISDDAWAELVQHHSTAALLEITFVVGHYTMLSLVANNAGVPPRPEWPALPA